MTSQEKDVVALPPCPFCGNTPASESDYNRDYMSSSWVVRCGRCGLTIEKCHHRGPDDNNQQIAEEAWRRIASGPPMPITFYTDAENERRSNEHFAKLEKMMDDFVKRREQRQAGKPESETIS